MKVDSRYKQALIEHLAIQTMRHAASKDRVFHFWFEYQDEISQALQKVERLEAEKAKLERFISKIENECEINMDHAGKHRKRAEEDYHTSKQYHQDGRWHGNYDILQFIQKHKDVKND